MMNWCEELKEHKYQPDAFSDMYDGTRWSSEVLGDVNIAPDAQLGCGNIVIGVSSDGVNPSDYISYSMWPWPRVA